MSVRMYEDPVPGPVTEKERTPGQVRYKDPVPGPVTEKERTPGQVRYKDPVPGPITVMELVSGQMQYKNPVAVNQPAAEQLRIPSQTLPPASDLRLCLLDVQELQDETLFGQYLADVSAERAAKAVRFRFPSGRALSLGAGLALDALLREYGFREKDMQYGYGANEKPYFLNAPGLHFSLSHSGTLVLACMGMGGSELGCDIQEEEKDQLSIARHFFHPDEYAWLMSISDEAVRRQSFYRLWVCKESFIKTLGTGLSTELSSFCVPLWEEPDEIGQRRVTGRDGEICFLTELEIPVPGYRGAVGVRGQL